MTTYTLSDLALMAQQYEREIAPGSETSQLSSIVQRYDYLSAIIDGDTTLDTVADVTDAYIEIEQAYKEMMSNITSQQEIEQ
jgi:hypothetical protein